MPDISPDREERDQARAEKILSKAKKWGLDITIEMARDILADMQLRFKDRKVKTYEDWELKEIIMQYLDSNRLEQLSAATDKRRQQHESTAVGD